MRLLVLLATAVTLTATDPVGDPRQLSWQPSGYYYQVPPAQQQIQQQQPLTVNWPFAYNPYAQQQDVTPVQFDRSGVEAQPPIQLRKVLSGGPYVAKVRHYSQPASAFYRGHVEARPQRIPTSYSRNDNYDYYGAAKLFNVYQQSEAFPKSRSEVEGRPRGVSVASARKAYLKDEKGAEDYKLVCYYGAWAVYRKDPMSFRPEMLDGIGCTHVIYAFAALDNQTYEIVSHDPKLDIDEGGYKNTTDLRKTNAGMKVLIAIGGWNEGVKKYSDMVSDGATRKKFVDSVVAFLEKHDFDGLDLDWEYPGDSERGGRHSDRDNYSLLVEELKAAFQSKGKGWLLTAAVPAPAFRVDDGYDVPRLAKSLDFFNVMTYDLHGSWDNFADHHAPLKERSHDYYPFNTLNSAYAMRHWNQQGAPKNKLVMGIPFYGRSFVLNDEKQNKGGPDSISSGDGFAGPYTEENGFLAYYEICKMIKDEQNWSTGKDSDGNVYAYNGKKWVGWDSTENVKRKIRFIKSQGYGGAMTWAIDLDDFNGVCGEKWPLVNAMKEELTSTKPIEEVDNEISVPDNGQDGQSSSPDQPFEPPSDRPDFKCPEAGIFSSPYSCNEFYECTPTAFLRRCPPGLSFDPKNRICNWPDQVECNIELPSNDVSAVYSSNVCQTLYDGLYSDPSDCSRMFYCSRGIQSKLACPYGQTFNAHSGACSFYSAARCNNGVMKQAYIAPNWPQGPLAGYFQPYATALLQPTLKKGNDKNVVCYFSNWANEREGDGKFVPENVDARLCSHVIYAYANLDTDSLEIVPSAPKVDVESGYYNRLQSTARTQNPQVKVLLGLGGWTDSTNGEKYSKLVTNKTARDNFVTKTVKMLETRGFDGLSLEWHFPVCWQSNCLAGKSDEKSGFADLVQELKEAFKSKDLLLSASLSGYVDKIGETAYDIKALGENLDFANVMTYDYHGFWDKKTGHHSPIKAQPNDQHPDFNLEYALNFYASKGFPKSKLNAGLPFYGQSFYLSGSANDVGSPSDGPGIPGRFTQQNGMLSYYEICAAISVNQLTKSAGSDSRGPYAYGSNRQWVGYDDVETITKKSNLIVDAGYGGAAVWTIDLDDFNNICCQGSFPLLNAASEVLRGVSFNAGSAGNCQRPPPVSTPPPPSTESTTWSDGNVDRYPTKPPQEKKPATTSSTTTTTTTTTTAASETATTTTGGSSTAPGQGGLSNGQFCTAENEYYADPSNCQKYFRCVNKRLVHSSCSEGLLWNHPSTQCTWPDTVQCGTRNNPIGVREGESSTSTTTTTAQPLDEDNGDYIEDVDNENNEAVAAGSKCNDGEYGVVEGECDSYTTCSNGVLYTKLCSPGLHWVQSKLSCDWPEVSGCKDTSDNNPSPRSNSGHHIGAGYTPPKWFLRYQKPAYSESGSCEAGTLTSHPKDCGSYLFCVHGKYQVFTCQSGTHWNNQQKICDHPESANCNGQASVDDSVLQGIESPPPASTTQSTTTTVAGGDGGFDNGQWSEGGQGGGGGDDSGQWEWKPPVTTTTETTFIETSNIKEPLSGDYKVVCYFTNWAWYRPGVGQYKPNDIDPTICTHVVYGFAVLDPTELIIKPHDSWADLDNEFYLKVTSLKKVGIKVTIAIGGWNDSEGDKYSRLVNNPSARRKFVDHVVGFVEKYNFDGLDLDWEYPSCWQVDCKDEHKSDKEGFAAWVNELSTAFKPKGLLLSAAVSPSKKVIDYAYDVPSIARDLDWISVMTYDYHGHWDKKTGHVAPMYHHPESEYDYFNTNFTMHYWIEQGAPRDKLIMGMPLYGQAFTLDNASNTGLNSPAGQKGMEGQFTRQAGFLAYYEICPKIKEGWQVVQDPEGRIGPYAYNGNQWVSFDDEKMIQHKSEYVRKMNLGGGMVWALDLDDFKNVCGNGHHPLMNTIKRILGPKKNGDESRNQISTPKDSYDTQVINLQIDNENKKPEEDINRQSSENAGEYKVVCYFTNWAVYRPDEGKFQPEDIDSNLCTHIVYGFAVLNPQTLQIRAHDSYVDFDREFYKKVSALKSKNKKVLLALGGWNDSEGDKYSRLVSDPSARNKFITHAVDFLKQHNFDGLDLDWEYPKCWQVDCAAGPVSDKANFADWVKELSDALKPEGLLLTAAVSPSARVIEQAYDIPVLSRYLDYISVMTYDYHGQWDKVTGHLAPLKEHPNDTDKTFNLEYSVKTWLDGGLDKKKLILGFPLYGQSFTLADVNNNSLNAPTYGGAEAGRYTRQRGFLSYYEICEKVTKEGWTVVRDPENRMGPYAYKGNQWVSFDDLDTVEQKVDFLKQQGLGGAMVWALDLDDFRGTFCQADDTYPLLRTINRGLGLLPPARTSIKDQLLQGLSENEIKNNLYFRTTPNFGYYLPYGADCSGGKPFAAHEADCAKYYQCGSNGQYEERACAPGLHWNQEKSICDWPATAGCTIEGSPAPDLESTQTNPWAPPPEVSPIINEVEGIIESTPPPTSAAVQDTGKLVVCYYTNWAWYRPGIGKYQPDDIDPTLCTHINFGFAVLDPNELVIKTHDTWSDIDNKFYERVVAMKNKGPKVLIALGGWNDSEGSKYSRMVNDANARAKFISNVLEFIDRFKFDGLDLDWEYPVCWQVDCKQGPKSDKDGFSALVKELSAAFKPKGLLLSAAVSPSFKVIDEGYDVPVLNKYLDHINVMTYDYYGHWDKQTGHVAPLYHHPDAATLGFNANFSMHYWAEKGADKKKLIMGMPMYGQTFTLNSPTPNGLKAPAGKGIAGEFTKQEGFTAYYEICRNIKNQGWQVTRDDSVEVERMGPYATKGLQWTGFDDSKTIRQKSKFIMDQGFGGGMIWALDLDDFGNVCGCEHYPLLRTINRVLRNYSLPDPGCDLKSTPTSSVKALNYINPNPVYGSPWVFSPTRNTPFTSVYYPTFYAQAPALG